MSTYAVCCVLKAPTAHMACGRDLHPSSCCLLPLRCGKLQADIAKWETRNDVHGRAKLAQTMAERDQHEKEHKGERDYAEDIWCKAEYHRHRITAFNMDAPTETQFEIPVQNRLARDVVKSLESAPRWSSKMMGLLIAGVGMRAYVARAALGGGPNLSLTVLYLEPYFFEKLHLSSENCTNDLEFLMICFGLCPTNKTLFI